MRALQRFGPTTRICLREPSGAVVWTVLAGVWISGEAIGGGAITSGAFPTFRAPLPGFGAEGSDID